MKKYQRLIIFCFIIANIFYFPWYRLERSIVTPEYSERLDELERNAIDNHDLSIDGNFESEVIYFDACSFSYKLFNIGYREKELIFFVNYQETPTTRIRHFIKVDIIAPDFLLSFSCFSSYVILIGTVLWMFMLETIMKPYNFGG